DALTPPNIRRSSRSERRNWWSNIAVHMVQSRLLKSGIPLRSKLPNTGVTLFTTMSRLALEHDAINLSQGLPDFNCARELIDAVARYMREGHNQYAPMPGTIAMREALAMKL